MLHAMHVHANKQINIMPCIYHAHALTLYGGFKIRLALPLQHIAKQHNFTHWQCMTLVPMVGADGCGLADHFAHPQGPFCMAKGAQVAKHAKNVAFACMLIYLENTPQIH